MVPQPPVPSASVPHMIWRFLAGMPWISVWQYPSSRTLVSTICLQLGQYLCPPFRVSIFMSSCLFVLLVGGGQGVLKLDWGQKFSSRWLAGMPRKIQDAIPLTLWMIDLESASKDLGKRSELSALGNGDYFVDAAESIITVAVWGDIVPYGSLL